MRIGVPTEIKDNEYRVGMTPSGAAVLTTDGHEVCVQAGAGNGSGFADDEYRAAGAKILPDADAVYDAADMIVKVKEPIEADLRRLKNGQLLFTYLHLAPVPDLTKALLDKNIVGIAYETITDERKRTLPLLTPMSEVAGRMSVHVGAYYLHKPNGGRGAEARHAGHDLRDEERLGHRRRRHRPGRLRRDRARHHALQSDLRSRRRHPLLRRQHAERGAAYVD